MRTKPCWSDNLGLEIVLGWIAAAIVATGLVLLSECAVTPAHAGQFSLEGGVGLSFFIPTIDDGTWYQQGLEHYWKRDSLAYKVGLSYAFNDHWSVSAAYLNMGQTGVDARTTLDDSYYDPIHHVCTANCTALGSFKVRDKMQGGEITVTRSFPMGDWSPFLKAGAAVMVHKLTSVNVDNANILTQHWHGNIPMTVLGGGVEYKPWHIALDTSWYYGLGGDDSGCIGGACGWPISKQVLVTLFTVKIPLGS